MYSQSTKKHKALKIDSVEQFLFFSLSKAVHVNIYVSSREADFQELYQSCSITNSTGLDFKTETCRWARYFSAASYFFFPFDCQLFQCWWRDLSSAALVSVFFFLRNCILSLERLSLFVFYQLYSNRCTAEKHWCLYIIRFFTHVRGEHRLYKIEIKIKQNKYSKVI